MMSCLKCLLYFVPIVSWPANANNAKDTYRLAKKLIYKTALADRKLKSTDGCLITMETQQ